jgi:hypothetical protein
MATRQGKNILERIFAFIAILCYCRAPTSHADRFYRSSSARISARHAESTPPTANLHVRISGEVTNCPNGMAVTRQKRVSAHGFRYCGCFQGTLAHDRMTRVGGPRIGMAQPPIYWYSGRKPFDRTPRQPGPESLPLWLRV